MAQLQTHLGFTGQCREAMTFYQHCLGGTLDLQTVAHAPVAADMPEGMQDRVLHASLINGELVLLGTDLAHDATRGAGVSLMLQCTDSAEAAQLFDRLAQGGTVTHPPSPSSGGRPSGTSPTATAFSGG